MAKDRWEFHPDVRSGKSLTLGERAADTLRNGMGSWAFVLGALAFLGAWIWFKGPEGIDPFPYILLNLILSCLAALQGAILLIAAKRADQIASDLAQSTFHSGQENLAISKELMLLSTEIHALTATVAAHLSDNLDKENKK